MSNERPRRARPRSTSGPEAQLVYGVHPVMEILHQRPGSVERVFAIREKGPGLGRVLRTARVAGIPITYLSRALLARRVGGGAVHQGIAAQVAPVPYRETEEICSIAAARKDGMLVLLDRVVDPRNLGAALRTCAAAGVTGVIVGSEGSAGLGPAAVKTSAGAVERIPVAREPRPAWRLERLREQGFEVLGLDPRGPDTSAFPRQWWFPDSSTRVGRRGSEATARTTAEVW